MVLGASPDPVADVKRFHDKQGLNFSLLADEDHAVAERYGVSAKKSVYVADVIPKVSPKTHDEQVLKILASM